MDWRPIETAPKDGRPVLVSDGLPFVARWKDGAWHMPYGGEIGYARLWLPIPRHECASGLWPIARDEPVPA